VSEVRRGIFIALRDGTRLAARVWLPVDADIDPVPAVLDLSQETEETKRLYGLDDPIVGPSAKNFLMLSRQRGVFLPWRTSQCR